MKIGDRVTSERWAIEGVIEDMRPCSHSGCALFEITLDKKGGTQFYWHSASFVVVDKKNQ